MFLFCGSHDWEMKQLLQTMLNKKWIFLLLAMLGVGAFAFLLFKPDSSGLSASVAPDSPYVKLSARKVLNLDIEEFKEERTAFSGKYILVNGVNPLQSNTLFENSLTRESLQLMLNTALPVVKPNLKDNVVIDTFENKPLKPISSGERAVEMRRLSVSFHLAKKPDTPRGLLLHIARPALICDSPKKDSLQPLMVWILPHHQPEPNDDNPKVITPLESFVQSLQWQEKSFN